MRPRLAILVLFALAACASGPAAMDLSGEGVHVVILGDGFVRVGGERIPLEAFILRTRQRLRELPDDQRIKYWVQVSVEQGVDDSARPQFDRLMDELTMMGVPQVVVS